MYVEPLELRIAPASILHFIDIDGDFVTITASSGDITATNQNAGVGVLIQSIDATQAPGADLIVSIMKVKGGDGLVNIGEIDAHGVNLGKVIIPGNLQGLTAGDGVEGSMGLRSLEAASLGVSEGRDGRGIRVDGAIGKVRIAGDVFGDRINAENGDLDSVFIGGWLFTNLFGPSAGITCSGRVGSIKIGKGMVCSAEYFTEVSVLAQEIGSMRVHGPIFGCFVSADKIGALRVSGDISTHIRSKSLAHLTIGGSFTGGDIETTHLGPIKIGRNFRASGQFEDGVIFADTISSCTP